jgi:hypothetical protein
VRRVLATIVALVVVGTVAVGCRYSMDSPERTLSLSNDTSGLRLVRRCDGLDDCRSPEEGDLVQPGESFEFDIYADEERAYVVANVDGETVGCIKVFIADGRPNPKSLSDLRQCPSGTPKATDE